MLTGNRASPSGGAPEPEGTGAELARSAAKAVGSLRLSRGWPGDFPAVPAVAKLPLLPPVCKEARWEDGSALASHSTHAVAGKAVRAARPEDPRQLPTCRAGVLATDQGPAVQPAAKIVRLVH